MAFEAKKSAAYSEPEKIRARRDALAHAVSMLTDKRDDVAIVPADYIDRVHKALLENDFDREHVKYFNTPLISEWQDLRSGVIGAKSPRDLTVAYLAGPEPLNDFDELVRLGVHPYNIWAFESEDVAFQSGLESIKSSHFPLLKLQKGNIDTFFQAVPRTFDLIYIDACGPLPSAEQRTLRTIANIFRYGRLSSPGVLITNFACPDVTNQQQRDAYAEFVSAYLWPKGCLESGDTEWNLDDGANAHSLSSMRIEGELWFTDKVREDFEFYYGQYITRQIFDVASFVAPWTRFANSDMWKSLFTVDPKSLAVRAAAFQHFAEDHDGGGGDFIVDPDMYAIGWTTTALANNRDENYPVLVAGTKLASAWRNQVSGHPVGSIDGPTAVLAYEVLRVARSSARNPKTSLFTAGLSELMGEYAYMQQMPMFCDVPTEELAFFPILAQYMMPAIYNTAYTRRFSYIASGKQTRMFLDIIPFDNCRYVFDWLPTAQLVGNSFQFLSQQLVFRFAIDALAKNCMRYNSEYLYGANVVGVNKPSFTEKLLSVRERR